MTNRLLIDGTDIGAAYGVYVAEGGYDELVAMPPLKKVKTADFYEYDGEDVDLSAPVLDSHEVSMTFVVQGTYGRTAAFLALITNGVYHNFNCTSIGRTYKLRLISEPKRSMITPLGLLTLKFADDFPLRNYLYLAPQSTRPSVDDFLFDGINFTDYGVRILEGSLDEISKKGEVKPAMLRNINTAAGAIYDTGATVKYKTRKANLNCLLRAATMTEFWRNHDAFLYDLTRPYLHVLTSSYREEVMYFYYDSCRTVNFFPDGWWMFTLSVNITARATDNEMKQALGVAPVTDTSTEAATVRGRLAASITTENVAETGQTIDDIDDSFVLGSDDYVTVLTETGDYAIDLYPTNNQ